MQCYGSSQCRSWTGRWESPSASCGGTGGGTHSCPRWVLARGFSGYVNALSYPTIVTEWRTASLMCTALSDSYTARPNHLAVHQIAESGSVKIIAQSKVFSIAQSIRICGFKAGGEPPISQGEPPKQEISLVSIKFVKVPGNSSYNAF